MEIRVRDLDSAALEDIGIVATLSQGKAPEMGAEFAFEFAATDLKMPAGLCAGRLECSSRPMQLLKMERHLKTPELLSAVNGDAVIVVAPPQTPQDERLEGLRAILVRQGQAIVLSAGAWHWIPYPLGEKSALFLVVFRSETGRDDLDYCELAEPGNIVFEGAKK